MFSKDATWSIIHVDDNFVIVKDMGLVGHYTITNQIYNVTAAIHAEYDLLKRHFIYMDTLGIFDAVECREDGNFYTFLELGALDHVSAMEQFKKRFPQVWSRQNISVEYH